MAVGLYETNEQVAELRQTKDLDCVIGITTRGKYFSLQEKLRSIGFKEDTSEGTPICRWKYEGIIVDIMPLDGDVLGFTNPWYAPGLDHLTHITLSDGTSVPVFAFPYFLATKIVAMRHRDDGVDLRWNHDFEDILHLLIHRRKALEEIQASENKVKRFIIDAFGALFKNPLSLKEAINAHLAYKTYSKETENEVFNLIRQIVAIKL